MKITPSIVSLLIVWALTGWSVVAGEKAGASADDQTAQAASPADQTETPPKKIIEQVVFRPMLSKDAEGPFDRKQEEKPLKVKIYPQYNKLPSGDVCYIAIELQVQRGWHINANPSKPDFLVPTKVELKTKQKIKLTKIGYPKPHPLNVAGSEQPYDVYDGKVIVFGKLEIEEPASSKFAELEFHVRFQGCNSNTCLPPDLVVMKGKLPLAAKGTPLKKINVEKFVKKTKKSASPTSEKK